MTRQIRSSLCSALFASLLLAAGPAAAELPPPEVLRGWIREMKLSPKGPFEAIRWYCHDGTNHPARPYPCEKRGGGIQQSRFADVFTQEYLKEHRLVDVRLTEQLESGTIEISNGCVKLTDKGQRLAAASRYFRQNFLPKQRLLMGQYSSDLTDPFRQSEAIVDYQCQ